MNAESRPEPLCRSFDRFMGASEIQEQARDSLRATAASDPNRTFAGFVHLPKCGHTQVLTFRREHQWAR